MISCAEVRAELVAMERGETPAALAQEVAYHIGRCADCAAERDCVRGTIATLHDHVHPDLSADARMRLRSLLDAQFVRSRRVRALRHLLLRAGVVLPLAAAAAALLVAVAGAPRQAPVGRVEPVAASSPVRTLHTAGALGPAALRGVSRGLAWLAANQRADGTWASASSSDPETTAAITASALLAFAADEQSPRRGPHARSLRRADERLAALVAGGFSADADRKPLYAQALGLRALAATYRLDRDVMTPEQRRERRGLLGSAGCGLVDSQNADGGFGYAPHAARSDASCTLFAAAALSDLRDADILDASSALARAGGFLGALRDDAGGLSYMRPGDRSSAPALTAALSALEGRLGLPAAGPRAMAEVERALAGGDDALLAWAGTAALARSGRPLETPVRTLLCTQRDDGAFPARTDRRCAAGGDPLTTAFGVLALAQVVAR